jgi:flagellar biosynthetic protein FliR
VLDEILSTNLFAFFLLFARLSGAMMLLPGFGEVVVSPRLRLSLTLAVSLAVFPLVGPSLPGMPASLAGLVGLILMEAVIGAFLGGAARVVMSALHVAGTVISFQSSLGFAQTVDPAAQSQGAIVSSLFGMLGVVLIFATGLHYLLLKALVDSYVLFPAGGFPPVGDLAELLVTIVAGAFTLGVRIAAPFVVYGLVFYTSLGLLGRLMPRIPLFFVAMPMQIMLSLTLLAIVLPAIMLWFLNYFEATITQLLAVG